MSEKRAYMDFLNDIVEMIEKIENFTEGYIYEEFIGDEKTVIQGEKKLGANEIREC